MLIKLVSYLISLAKNLIFGRVFIVGLDCILIKKVYHLIYLAKHLISVYV